MDIFYIIIDFLRAMFDIAQNLLNFVVQWQEGIYLVQIFFSLFLAEMPAISATIHSNYYFILHLLESWEGIQKARMLTVSCLSNLMSDLAAPSFT